MMENTISPRKASKIAGCGLSLIKVEVFKQISINVPSLGQKIRDAREKDGRSAQVLATLAEISISYWYQIEQEKREAISEETLRSIEKALGVDFGVEFE